MQQSCLSQEEKEDHEGDNPALSRVVERNIRTIIQLRLKADQERSLQDRIADVITAYSGRMLFVYGHILWFGLWIWKPGPKMCWLKLIASNDANSAEKSPPEVLII